MKPIQKRKKINNNSLCQYIERNASFVPVVLEKPVLNLRYCIVIPCYNETNILDTLNSIEITLQNKSGIEIIVVINSPEKAPEEVIAQNEETAKSLKNWGELNKSEFFALHVIKKPDLPMKKAGVGQARKFGMDEAIYRFLLADQDDGVIISLDADTICSKNYLNQIDLFYRKYPKAKGCNINFEHDLDSINDEKLRNAVAQYELYLRYYIDSIRFTGFPNAYHTIGSCFSVKASAYCMQGGMNVKKAGEDFYFLQKLFYLDNFYELNSAVVYPGTRISNRVIFGTGPSINKIYNTGMDFNVYNFHAFKLFKGLFYNFRLYYQQKNKALKEINRLPETFKDFLQEYEIYQKLEEITENVSGVSAFEKRLFQKFNNFFIVKGLNYLHRHAFEKYPVKEGATDYLRNIGYDKDFSIYELLNFFRQFQKQRPVILP